MENNKKNLHLYLIPLFLLITDQLTKFLVLYKMPGQGIFLIATDKFEFGFKLVKNINLAFSIALPQFVIFIIVFTLIVILSYFLYRGIKKKNNVLIFSLLMIIVGAISNLFDRLAHGAVIDFVTIKIWDMQLAVFNLADIWIVIGVAILLFKEPRKQKKL